MEKIAEVTALVSVIISGLTVFFAPWLSSRYAMKQLISPMREKWIQNFRECLADLLAIAETLTWPGVSLTNEVFAERLERMFMLRHKAKLFLAPHHNDHKGLELLLDNLIGAIQDNKVSFEQKGGIVRSLSSSIVSSAQPIIDEAWDQVSKGKSRYENQ